MVRNARCTEDERTHSPPIRVPFRLSHPSDWRRRDAANEAMGNSPSEWGRSFSECVSLTDILGAIVVVVRDIPCCVEDLSRLAEQVVASEYREYFDVLQIPQGSEGVLYFVKIQQCTKKRFARLQALSVDFTAGYLTSSLAAAFLSLKISLLSSPTSFLNVFIITMSLN